MSSLREIRDHVASVRNTLKITSALKLVSSSKLRKAQKAIDTLLPYARALSGILESCNSGNLPLRPAHESHRAAVVVIAGNSSMCGGFNANVCRKALDVLRSARSGTDLFALGRKAAETLGREGYKSSVDAFELIARPSYEDASSLAKELWDKYDEVNLVYNHFVSTSRQEPTVESLFDFNLPDGSDAGGEDYIIEPGAEEVVKALLPKVVSLRLFSVILDSAAAEHAARMIAMQAATDNAEGLLSELTLEYNKGRQQKITSEILDLVGGSMS